MYKMRILLTIIPIKNDINQRGKLIKSNQN